MRIKLINDWKYLFNKDAAGGRFSVFTFINLAFIKVGEPEIDGLTMIILGLGLTIYPAKPNISKEQK